MSFCNTCNERQVLYETTDRHNFGGKPSKWRWGWSIEAKDDGGGDNWTTGVISRAKLQSNHPHQQTNIQYFTGQMPFLSPNQQCQSTEGKNITFIGLAYPSSPGGLPTLSLTTISSWLPWGGLPCLSSALRCQYPTDYIWTSELNNYGCYVTFYYPTEILSNCNSGRLCFAPILLVKIKEHWIHHGKLLNMTHLRYNVTALLRSNYDISPNVMETDNRPKVGVQYFLFTWTV